MFREAQNRAAPLPKLLGAFKGALYREETIEPFQPLWGGSLVWALATGPGGPGPPWTPGLTARGSPGGRFLPETKGYWQE